ncbi:MAG: hypothetical protein ACOH2F_06325 [Cellulomonas sp.]
MVIAVVDGGVDDAQVLDAALTACVAGGHGLRLIHVYGPVADEPTPWAEAYAREYLRGAAAVVHLVPGVEVSVVLVPWVRSSSLRAELAHAEMLISSAHASVPVLEAGQPARATTVRCPVRTVPSAGTVGDRLRFGYRLALQNELGRTDGRDDGATTPDELDIAWRVGVACPELSAEAIRAWSTCSAWPPRHLT